jgi:hypothetical protein
MPASEVFLAKFCVDFVQTWRRPDEASTAPSRHQFGCVALCPCCTPTKELYHRVPKTLDIFTELAVVSAWQTDVDREIAGGAPCQDLHRLLLRL